MAQEARELELPAILDLELYVTSWRWVHVEHAVSLVYLSQIRL